MMRLLYAYQSLTPIDITLLCINLILLLLGILFCIYNFILMRVYRDCLRLVLPRYFLTIYLAFILDVIVVYFCIEFGLAYRDGVTLKPDPLWLIFDYIMCLKLLYENILIYNLFSWIYNRGNRRKDTLRIPLTIISKTRFKMTRRYKRIHNLKSRGE